MKPINSLFVEPDPQVEKREKRRTMLNVFLGIAVAATVLFLLYYFLLAPIIK